MIVASIDHSYDQQMMDHLELFHYHPDVEVIGPSRFPRPTELPHLLDDDIVPYITPYHGQHRPDHDAVVAYAAEYPLANYITFIESLRDSGFTGDIVLALSPLDVRNNKNNVCVPLYDILFLDAMKKLVFFARLKPIIIIVFFFFATIGQKRGRVELFNRTEQSRGDLHPRFDLLHGRTGRNR
jgi:hypothetical protein